MEIAEDNPCHQPGRDHCGLSDLTQDNLEIASLSMIENHTSRDRRGDMRLEVVTEIEHFRDLREDWNRLLSKYEPTPLPLTHEWLFTWWQVFGADRQLHIICVYDGEKLVAVAPFLQEVSRHRGMTVSMQKLMSNGHSPFCDLIVDGDAPEGQVSKILELIISLDTADVLQFNKVPEDSMVVRYLRHSAGKIGNRYGITPSLTTTVIQIRGNWGDFIKAKSRKFRSSLNNKLNRFNKAGDFTLKREDITSRDDPYLTQMVEISKQSWKQEINKDLGSDVAGREFLLLLADEFGPAGNVSLWIAHKSDVPVAFEYHLELDGVVYPLRADFSESFRSFSPGSVLEYETLKTLFEDKKIKEYYSCADDYWYLRNWSNETRKHVNVELFADSLKAQMLYAIGYIIIPKFRTLREKLFTADSAGPKTLRQ